MSDELFLKFVPQVQVEKSDEAILLHHPHYGAAIRLPLDADWLVTTLLNASHSEDTLLDHHQGDFQAMQTVMALYQQLNAFGLIGFELRDDDTPLLHLYPQVAGFEVISIYDLDEDTIYRVSRFAYIHFEDKHFLIEAARGKGYIAVQHPDVLAWFAAFQQGLSIAAFLEDYPQDHMETLLCCFISIGALVSDDESELANWDFHDALLHTRSRDGRFRMMGGKRTVDEAQPIPPPIKQVEADIVIALPQPDMADLIAHDVTLTHALENRTSLRQHGIEPLTFKQLGEFLYRTVRVTGYREGDGIRFTKRLYPAGGAVYELELYLAIRACEGIEAGLYHYNAEAHTLSQISTFTPDIEQMMQRAASAALVDNGQILLLMTARFQRINRFYHTITYSLILKHVGVLMQTMYLVASAMNLAICAIGNGDSDLIGQALGLSYFEEGAVGELLLGRPAID